MTTLRRDVCARTGCAIRLATRGCAFLLLAAALLAGPTAFTGQALAQSSDYSNWQPPAEDSELSQFMDELEALVGKAEQAKAADPLFLKDLNNLIATYRNPWSTRLLYDDFSDGNFTANPKWSVSAGDYIIDPGGTYRGLRSAIVPEGQQTGQNISIGNIVIGTLGTGQTGEGGHASIYTPVRISNAFRVAMQFTSKHKYGRWDFGPYQGASGNVAYRLSYFPNATPGLQIQRVTSAGTTAIASYNKALPLETNSDHTLVWTRDRSGMMRVAIDGKELLSVQDTAIKDPFDGFLMINSGGQYSVRWIEILGRPVPN